MDIRTALLTSVESNNCFLKYSDRSPPIPSFTKARSTAFNHCCKMRLVSTTKDRNNLYMLMCICVYARICACTYMMYVYVRPLRHFNFGKRVGRMKRQEIEEWMGMLLISKLQSSDLHNFNDLVNGIFSLRTKMGTGQRILWTVDSK